MRIRRAHFWIGGLLGTVLVGCDNMQHQENVRPFNETKLFADGSGARIPPAGTIARDDPGPADPLTTYQRDGAWVDDLPMPLTRDLVERGASRYAIFCAECHGADGYGHGVVVRRGFPAPPSFHTLAGRAEPAGQVYSAIARGSGVMYGFADRLTPRDRWALVAYIRALQRSQNATLSDVPPSERPRLLAP